MKTLLSLGLLAALVLPSALAAQAANRAGADFIFSPGDRVQVSVWPDSSLGGTFPIEESGVVFLPLLGSRDAAGKTVDEFREELREGYAQDLQLPVVSLRALFRVSILGAVRAPGVYWVDPSYGVFDLLAEAGGLVEDAEEDKMVITRTSGETYRIDARRLSEPGSGESLLALRSGDQLVVPENKGFNWGIFLQTLTLAVAIANLVAR